MQAINEHGGIGNRKPSSQEKPRQQQTTLWADAVYSIPVFQLSMGLCWSNVVCFTWEVGDEEPHRSAGPGENESDTD